MYQILKGGCNARHSGSFIMLRPEGLPNYIMLIIRSYGEFHMNGQTICVTPGHAIIIAPHTPYSYSNPKGDYVDDWLHFSTENNAYFHKLFPMTNILFPIKNTEIFTTLIRQLLWEQSYTPSACVNQNIDALFSVLLNHLITAYHTKNEFKTFSAFQQQLQDLRLHLQSTLSEAHSIRNHALEMGISESYFQHLYRDFFGISFQKDLIQLRIEHAKYILTTTNLTLEQVAIQCGYSNEVHFYRQFKQLTGMTPSAYRTL